MPKVRRTYRRRAWSEWTKSGPASRAASFRSIAAVARMSRREREGCVRPAGNAQRAIAAGVLRMETVPVRTIAGQVCAVSEWCAGRVVVQRPIGLRACGAICVPRRQEPRLVWPGAALPALAVASAVELVVPAGVAGTTGPEPPLLRVS